MDENLEGTGNVNSDDDRTTNDLYPRAKEREKSELPLHWDPKSDREDPIFPVA